ncbi:MAG: hypothetical protein ACI33K_07500 [Clostridiaceae bacterium]
MGKPSIFSKEYQKHKKRRQKKIAFLVLFLMVIILFFAYVSPVSQLIKGSSLYKELQAKYKDNGSTEKHQEGVVSNSGNNGDSQEDKESNEEENTAEDKYFEISLTEGKEGKAYYKESDGKIIFLSYSGGEGFQYEVSPSKEKMMIFDVNDQNIYEIEAESAIKNLTYEYYTTTKGSKINKSNTLTSNPEYLWHGSPRYISENRIVYKSHLPWLNSANEYIWIIDTNTMGYSYINSSKGKVINFGSLSEEGLQVTIDGVNRILLENGSLR